MNEQQVRTDVQRFVLDQLLLGDPQAMLGDDESFLETGTIDSTGVLEVVTFLEEHFSIEVLDKELIPENLDSINRIVAFVQGKCRVA